MKKASVTVEASFVVPIVVWIVCFVLVQTLIQGDRGILILSADRVLEELLAHDSNGEIETSELSDIEQTVKNNISRMLLVHLVKKVKVKEDNMKYQVYIEVERMPAVSFGQNKEYIVTRNISKCNICSGIRGKDVAKDMFE